MPHGHSAVPSFRRRLTAGFWIAALFTLAVKVARSVGVTAGGLTGALPNFGFSVAMTLLFARWTSPTAAALTATLAGVLNELSQLQARPWLVFAGRTFDPWDLLASILGAGLGYGLVLWAGRAGNVDDDRNESHHGRR